MNGENSTRARGNGQPRSTVRSWACIHALKTALLIAVALAGSAEASAPVSTPFEGIRAVDTALARIGYGLATANAPLCDRLEPGIGLVLHTPTQYAKEFRSAAVRHFRLTGPVGVEAVIEGSPAARAGIRQDDILHAAGAVRFTDAKLEAEMSTEALIEATAAIAGLPPAQPLQVRGRRAEEPIEMRIEPVPACRTRFEVAIRSDFEAQADGEMVQISSRFLEDYPEDEVAAVVAHELAHNILRHRERLEARGVSFGMAAGFGRNLRFFRQTELEADILSISLLANAGYDPAAALRFWRKFGPNHGGGILRSRSHPAWRDRVAVMERAITELGSEAPHRPALLASRGRPLDGDWRSLVRKQP